MIEAITSCNSIHGGKNILQTNGSYYNNSRGKASAIVDDAKRLAVVGISTGAISMITDTVLNSQELFKTNPSVIKGILKDAAIWGALGGICYSAFRLMEAALIGKPREV